MTTAERGKDLTVTSEVGPGPHESSDGLRAKRWAQPLLAAEHLGTWIGLLIAATGLVLIVVAWGRVAALTNVALQIPYLISAGLTGLGLVVVGLAVVNLSVHRRIAAQRSAQLGELRALLAELRRTVEGRDQ